MYNNDESLHSIARWNTLSMSVISSKLFLWLLGCMSVVTVSLYLKLVRVRRYRNLKNLKAKYGFTDDVKTYQNMSVEIAREIYYNLATRDMPFLFEFGWIINFLKVSVGIRRADCLVDALRCLSAFDMHSHPVLSITVLILNVEWPVLGPKATVQIGIISVWMIFLPAWLYCGQPT